MLNQAAAVSGWYDGFVHQHNGYYAGDFVTDVLLLGTTLTLEA
jgi:hypothetical protein